MAPDNDSAAPELPTPEITQEDETLFFSTVSQELNPEQVREILSPPEIFPLEKSLLAIHWHPEFIPLDLIARRMAAMFPNAEESLIIPTQHNSIMTQDGFSGVEMDCYSKGFNQKVQLLLHFRTENLDGADVFKSMLAHTFKYRSSQLLEFIHTITRPVEDRINQAAAETGSGERLIRFVNIYVNKIKDLLEIHAAAIPPDALKNKLLRNFFDELRPEYGDDFINRVQNYLRAVKQLVKANFSNIYFYRTSEVIEEVRSLNGGIVVPHPEQFWPILLAGYDVDGYEVWNPQSSRYTEFLISVLNEKNRNRLPGKKELLLFMGDDTHMGEKVKLPSRRDPAKAAREVGVQPAWDDLNISKALICANIDKAKVIREYRARLSG